MMRVALVAVALILAGVGAWALLSSPSEDPTPSGPRTPLGPGEVAPGFDGGGAWLGSGPIMMETLRGQVVLVDFWTYSCINCIRTLPHLTAWDDAYEEHGLAIVGVHSPEFDFEKDPANVQDAIHRYGIQYPVVQDNDYDVWRSYENRYWPAKFLIDKDGIIQYTKFGEGAYQQTEQEIRRLLSEAGATDLPQPVEEGDERGPRGRGITPELYAGTWRQPEALGNPEGYRPGEVVEYAPTEGHRRDAIYLEGAWFNGEEALTSRSDATVHLAFKAGALNLVAAGSGCIEVLLDGEPIREELAGADVAFDRQHPCIPLDGERSYDVYAGAVAERALELRVPADFSLYTFAFSAYPS